MTKVDHIEEQSEWQHHSEVWRFYQSGQFVDLRAISEDWRDVSELWPPDKGWRRGGRLGIGDAVFSLYEVFEFAARFANAVEGDDAIIIKANIGGLKDRALYIDDPRRLPLRDQPKGHLDKFPQKYELSRTEVVEDPKRRAVLAAQELFRRFGREFPDHVLRDWLERMLNQR